MKYLMKTLTALMIILVTILLYIIYNRLQPGRLAPIWVLARPKMVPIESAINVYYKNTGQYPNTLEDLIVCPSGYENLWCGPYVKEKQLYDPWNNMYIYEPNSLNTDGYNLISYGADGSPEGEGDNKDIYND